MAAKELIIYCAQKLCCSVGDDILLWISDPSLIASGNEIVEATITEDMCINSTTRQYTVEYEDAVLTDPGTPLTSDDLKTYCCGSCIKQYVDEKIAEALGGP